MAKRELSRRGSRSKRWEHGGSDVPAAPLPQLPQAGKRNETETGSVADAVPQRVCARCGASLAGKRRHARYCSDVCRAQASKGRAELPGRSVEEKLDEVLGRLDEMERRLREVERGRVPGGEGAQS